MPKERWKVVTRSDCRAADPGQARPAQPMPWAIATTVQLGASTANPDGANFLSYLQNVNIPGPLDIYNG